MYVMVHTIVCNSQEFVHDICMWFCPAVSHIATSKLLTKIQTSAYLTESREYTSKTSHLLG